MADVKRSSRTEGSTLRRPGAAGAPQLAPRLHRSVAMLALSSLSGWWIALGIVGAILGFLVFVAGGCDLHGACSCPPPPTSAVVHLGCLPVEPPVVKTTGPCSVCPVTLANGSIPEGSHCAVPDYSQDITLEANGAGTCHVELTFGSGATSSVDLNFTSEWIACGSDPHGCGEGFVATNADGCEPWQVCEEYSDGSVCSAIGCQASVPEPVCDGGLDAEASD